MRTGASCDVLLSSEHRAVQRLKFAPHFVGDSLAALSGVEARDRRLIDTSSALDFHLSEAELQEIRNDGLRVHTDRILHLYLLSKCQCTYLAYYDCNMDTFATRVRARRERLGLSQEQLSKVAGVSQSTIAQIENGRNKGTKHIIALADALRVQPKWLSEGGMEPEVQPRPDVTKGPAQSDQALSNATPHLPGYPTDDEFALVPQLDVAASCGDGRFIDHVVVKGGLAFKRSSLRDFGVSESSARIIYASGGSMWPTIQDGCVVLLNTADRSPIEGKVYAICTPDGGLLLKRLIRDYHPSIGAQTWIMRSDNPDKTVHPDKVLPPDDRTMVVGRAVWNDNKL